MFSPSPKKSPSGRVQRIDHSLRKLHRSHGVDRETVENGIDKDQAPLVVQKASPPAGQIPIGTRDQRREGRYFELLMGERQPQVSLRKPSLTQLRTPT
jgi:hypothetical protein